MSKFEVEDKKFRFYLREAGKKLQKAKIPSEEWFKGMLDKSMRRKHLAFNKPFGRYIPDVRNEKQKYLIEIDGSIHDTPEQRAKDEIKDKFYRSRGYEVFRVKAFNEISFWQTLKAIKAYRLKIQGEK